jgi:hypothetical protein
MTRIVLLSLLLIACGGATGSPTPPPPPTPTPAPTISEACAEQLEPVLEALEELDGRLDVGLTKVQYGERMGDIAVEYNRLDIDELSAEASCLAVAVILEDAYNQYITANNEWSDCISDTDCDTESIQPTLQRHWSAASRKIEEARASFTS